MTCRCNKKDGNRCTYKNKPGSDFCGVHAICSTRADSPPARAVPPPQARAAPPPVRADVYHGQSFVSFGSNAKHPYHQLSNFAWIREGINIDGIEYPSTEHAYQAQKFLQKDRFSTGGDIGQESGFSLFYPAKEVESKQKYWMKKGNIGILAKMASSKDNVKKLKLKDDPSFDLYNMKPFWMRILQAKYSIPLFRDLLMSTGTEYLLEFSRSAKKENSFWAGLIEDGRLYGKNTMGTYLMDVREHFRRPRAKAPKRAKSRRKSPKRT